MRKAKLLAVFSVAFILSIAVFSNVMFFQKPLPEQVLGTEDTKLCQFPVTNDLPHLSSTIQLEKTENYALWLNLFAPDENKGLLVKLDNNCPSFYEGSPGKWIWENRVLTLSNKMENIRLLSKGSHTISIFGQDNGVKLDRLLLTSQTGCIPTGDGSNCISMVSVSPSPVLGQ